MSQNMAMSGRQLDRAALLPALLYSLNAQPRHHTWIFVELFG